MFRISLPFKIANQFQMHLEFIVSTGKKERQRFCWSFCLLVKCMGCMYVGSMECHF